ncbi:hypothetical protein [Methylocella sp.]
MNDERAQLLDMAAHRPQPPENAAQNPPVINPRRAARLVRQQPSRLRV